MKVNSFLSSLQSFNSNKQRRFHSAKSMQNSEKHEKGRNCLAITRYDPQLARLNKSIERRLTFKKIMAQTFQLEEEFQELTRLVTLLRNSYKETWKYSDLMINALNKLHPELSAHEIESNTHFPEEDILRAKRAIELLNNLQIKAIKKYNIPISLAFKTYVDPNYEDQARVQSIEIGLRSTMEGYERTVDTFIELAKSIFMELEELNLSMHDVVSSALSEMFDKPQRCNIEYPRSLMRNVILYMELLDRLTGQSQILGAIVEQAGKNIDSIQFAKIMSPVGLQSLRLIETTQQRLGLRQNPILSAPSTSGLSVSRTLLKAKRDGYLQQVLAGGLSRMLSS